MKFELLNITKNYHKYIELPMCVKDLKATLGNDEYFVNANFFGFEFDVYGLNDFLLKASRNQISELDLLLLNINQVDEDVVLEQKYVILPFSNDTKAWNNGTGGDVHCIDDIGIYLYQNGMLTVPWDLKDDADYSYIDWAYVCNTYDKSIDPVKYENTWYLILW